jgi:hypothetical protein
VTAQDRDTVAVDVPDIDAPGFAFAAVGKDLAGGDWRRSRRCGTGTGTAAVSSSYRPFFWAAEARVVAHRGIAVLLGAGDVTAVCSVLSSRSVISSTVPTALTLTNRLR